MRCVPPPTSTRDAVAPVVGADKLKDPPPTERIPPLATPPSQGLLTREEALSSERATPSAGVPPSVACIAAAWPADRRGSLRTLHPLTAPSAHAPQTDKHSTRASGRQPSPRPTAQEHAARAQRQPRSGLDDSMPTRATGRSAETQRATPASQGPPPTLDAHADGDACDDEDSPPPGADAPPAPRQCSTQPSRLSGEQPTAYTTPARRPGRVGARGRQPHEARSPTPNRPTRDSLTPKRPTRDSPTPNRPNRDSPRPPPSAGARAGGQAGREQPGENGDARARTRHVHDTPYTQPKAAARGSGARREEPSPARAQRSALETSPATVESARPEPRHEPAPKAPGERLASGEYSP